MTWRPPWAQCEVERGPWGRRRAGQSPGAAPPVVVVVPPGVVGVVGGVVGAVSVGAWAWRSWEAGFLMGGAGRGFGLAGADRCVARCLATTCDGERCRRVVVPV